MAGPYVSASVERTMLVALAQVYTPLNTALPSFLTKIRVPTVCTLAVSIKLNTPVVVNSAPTPLPAPLGCVYEIVPPVAAANVVVVAAATAS